MATSFSLTRTQIANRVLAKVTKVPNDRSMESVDAELVYQAIDLRLKEMSKLGTFWRKVTAVPVSFSLTSGIASASAGAGDILWPVAMTFRDGEDDIPIDIIGKTGQRGTGTGDSRYVNVLFEVDADPAPGSYPVACLKRPGLANSTQPPAGAATGRGVYAWSGR